MKIISNDKDSHINKTTNLFDLLDMAETTKKEDIIRKIYKENEDSRIHKKLCMNKNTPSDVLGYLAIEYYKEKNFDILFSIYANPNCDDTLHIQIHKYLSERKEFSNDKFNKIRIACGERKF